MFSGFLVVLVCIVGCGVFCIGLNLWVNLWVNCFLRFVAFFFEKRFKLGVKLLTGGLFFRVKDTKHSRSLCRRIHRTNVFNMQIKKC